MLNKKHAPVGISKKVTYHFEIVKESGVMFSDVGGYDNIKRELEQCIDIISNGKFCENTSSQ